MPGLKPQLRPYQRRAVAWMLRREHASSGPASAQRTAQKAATSTAFDAGPIASTAPSLTAAMSAQAPAAASHPAAAAATAADGLLHKNWREVRCLDGRTVYLNPYSGDVAWSAFPPAPLVPEVKGGILSEEMGESRSCILLCFAVRLLS